MTERSPFKVVPVLLGAFNSSMMDVASKEGLIGEIMENGRTWN
ncbi:hypothetical protein T01_4385 [Trichinella spiralis]|uniref:Uncharacterized protein n=1 Tax=Trichinella spiralis TaxID=6334 RepID=A0A0V1AVQ2_TRISP|nr:hypothetical protein T01_4385 [Trichinella spiralis]